MPTVRVVFDEADRLFYVYSSSSQSLLKTWDINAQGKLRKLGEPALMATDLDKLRERMERHYSHEAYYQHFHDAGYQFGPNFQHVQKVWCIDYESIVEIQVPEAVLSTVAQYRFHPAVLDACFHGFSAAQIVPADAKPGEHFYLPAKIGRVRIFREPVPLKLWAHTRTHFDDGESLISTILVYDESGSPVAEIVDFQVDRAPQKDKEAQEVDNSFYQFQYEPCHLRGSRVVGPAQLSSIASVIDEVNRVMPDIRDTYFSFQNYFEEFRDNLEKAAVQSILNAFIKLGWAPSVGERFTFDELVQQLGILKTHHRLFNAQLETLTSEGWLQYMGDQSWEVVKRSQTSSVETILNPLIENFEQFASEAELQKLTAASLAEVLIGDVEPVELLFPDGKAIDTLKRFYREGTDFPANNELIRAAVENLIVTLPSRRTLRVLEVGAGTGSLTRAVLSVLPANRCEFTFTDVSPAFLKEARQQFSDYGFIEYKTFDIEKDPQSEPSQKVWGDSPKVRKQISH